MVIRTRFVRDNVTTRFFYIFVFLIFKALGNFIVFIEQFVRFNIIFLYYIFLDYRVRLRRVR